MDSPLPRSAGKVDALLCFPQNNSIGKILADTLRSAGLSCAQISYTAALRQWEKRLEVQMFRLPDRVRSKWEAHYLGKINRWYLRQFAAHQPGLVFIYNNEMLLPETLRWLKERQVQIAFLLADNPLYTFTNRYNLTILEYADAIFVPDTFWQQQLKKMGLQPVHHFLLPLPDGYYPTEQITSEERRSFTADALYVGMGYKDAWGYKKARFLSYFADCKLRIFGNEAWERWFPFFPELRPCFIKRDTLIPTEQLNKMYNCAKIIPVDGNPGIMNGIHLRVLEALAAGTLPLMEWNADVDFIFEEVADLPVVKDYQGIPEMVRCYLADEAARKRKVEEMRACYARRYSQELAGRYLLDCLKLPMQASVKGANGQSGSPSFGISKKAIP